MSELGSPNAAANREALAGLEAAHGKVRAAIIWGQACAHVNDPAFDHEWWDAALAEADALAMDAHLHRKEQHP